MDGERKKYVSAFKELIKPFGSHYVEDNFTRIDVRIYLGKRIQQRKLCRADVDRQRADIKPANQDKERTVGKK